MLMNSDLESRVRAAAPAPTFDAEDVRSRATRRHHRRRISTIFVAVAIAAVGVGGLLLPGFGRPERTLPAARIDGVIHQAHLPITDALAWTTNQQRSMTKAESLLQSACMRQAGFDLPAVPFHPFTGVDRRYGLKDLEAARMRGYGLPPMGPDPQQAYVDALSQEDRREFYRAFLGAPDGAEAGADNAIGSVGCAEEARNTIYGSATSSRRADVLYQMLVRLDAEAYFASEEDGLVQLAKDAWIDCMEGRGYNVSSLDDPMDASVLLPAGTPEGGPADIDLAVSVVECNDATDLVEIWSGVEAEIQQKLLTEHRAEMEEFLSLRTHALENADRIVQEESAP
jgi:hypothetical protein